MKIQDYTLRVAQAAQAPEGNLTSLVLISGMLTLPNILCAIYI